MSDALVVHVCIFIFNFLASIIQGLTGFGDAVLLHVLWYTACVAKPDIFLSTPLGDKPVSAVALLMYVRIIFSTPLVAYLSFKDGIFSWSMTIAMAIPSTICAIGGVFVFARLQHGDVLKQVLGISSLIFAIMYVIILASKYAWKQKKVRVLMEKLGVKKQKSVKPAPADGGGESGASDTGKTAAASVAVDVRPAVSATHPRSTRAHDVVIASETDLVEEELAATRNNSFAGIPTDDPLTCVPNRPSDDGNATRSAAAAANDGVNDTDEVYLSLETGSPFHRGETRTIPVTEPGAHVPPLTPSKVSPTRTMTYTRVRVNRNLDENGKVKRGTVIGGSISAAFSGVMGSLTGVGAPPQIIFILLMDVPQYVIRVNFCMQSIPSALARFIMACTTPLFHQDMIPIFINSLTAGYVGVFVGTKLGKMLGPKSYNVFVLSILLLSSLIMITESAALLVVLTLLCTGITVFAAWWEKKQERTAKITAQRAMEAEIAESNVTHVKVTDGPTNRSPVLPIPMPRSGSGSTLNTNGSFNRPRKAELNRPPSLFTTPTTPAAERMATEETPGQRHGSHVAGEEELPL